MGETNPPCRSFPNKLGRYFTLKEGKQTKGVVHSDFLPNNIVWKGRGKKDICHEET